MRKILTTLTILGITLSLAACNGNIESGYPAAPVSSSARSGFTGDGPESRPQMASPSPESRPQTSGSSMEPDPFGGLEPDGSNTPWADVNGGEPRFTTSDLTVEPFEMYSDLDEYGRCGVAFANICQELMPTGPRGEIGQIKPSGWHTIKYDCVDGKYLFNRCHLIGYQLAGENSNEKNLITGTRYFNVQGMLPFENMVVDYVKETHNHVLYRVTPDFRDSELLAHGVDIEAYSVEDNGDGIRFNVYVFNIQPGISIDYATGESVETPAWAPGEEREEPVSYILNVRSKKFHRTDCEAVGKISEKNRKEFSGERGELVSQGYKPCGACKP